jgi:hypothetical protein
MSYQEILLQTDIAKDKLQEGADSARDGKGSLDTLDNCLKLILGDMESVLPHTVDAAKGVENRVGAPRATFIEAASILRGAVKDSTYPAAQDAVYEADMSRDTYNDGVDKAMDVVHRVKTLATHLGPIIAEIRGLRTQIDATKQDVEAVGGLYSKNVDRVVTAVTRKPATHGTALSAIAHITVYQANLRSGQTEQ